MIGPLHNAHRFAWPSHRATLCHEDTDKSSTDCQNDAVCMHDKSMISNGEGHLPTSWIARFPPPPSPSKPVVLGGPVVRCASQPAFSVIDQLDSTLSTTTLTSDLLRLHEVTDSAVTNDQLCKIVAQLGARCDKIEGKLMSCVIEQKRESTKSRDELLRTEHDMRAQLLNIQVTFGAAIVRKATEAHAGFADSISVRLKAFEDELAELRASICMTIENTVANSIRAQSRSHLSSTPQELPIRPPRNNSKSDTSVSCPSHDNKARFAGPLVSPACRPILAPPRPEDAMNRGDTDCPSPSEGCTGTGLVGECGTSGTNIEWVAKWDDPAACSDELRVSKRQWEMQQLAAMNAKWDDAAACSDALILLSSRGCKPGPTTPDTSPRDNLSLSAKCTQTHI